MTIVAFAEDRERLLAFGEMRCPIYTDRAADVVSGESYASMRVLADLMGLGLTEPIVEVEPADWTGNRVVRTRAGVFDLTMGATA